MADPLFTAKGSTLKAISDLVSATGSEDFLLTVDTDLSLCSPDPAHHMMLEYSTPRGGPLDSKAKLGISNKRLADATKAFAATDQVDAYVEGERLVLKCGKRRRAIAMVNPSYIATPKVPAIPWAHTIAVPIAWLKACCKASAGIKGSDSVRLTIAGGELLWHMGDEVNDFDDSTPLDLGPEASAKVCVTHEYLEKFVAEATSTDANLSMGDDLPIKLAFGCGEGRATLLLAPRTEA